jgi:hypothetical protein
MGAKKITSGTIIESLKDVRFTPTSAGACTGRAKRFRADPVAGDLLVAGGHDMCHLPAVAEGLVGEVALAGVLNPAAKGHRPVPWNAGTKNSSGAANK